MRTRMAAWAALLVGMAWVAGAAPCTIQHEDLDQDGEAEIILANRYLRVELMTGVPPAAPEEAKEAKWFDWLRRRPAEPAPPPVPAKYGKRFAWGGWIHNIEFVPSGRRWFTNKIFGQETWNGIPEEFEETVKMAELEDGSFACLKVGIGTAIGHDLCLRGSLKDVVYVPWTVASAVLADGTGVVTFTQTVDTEYGYGYVYTKEVRLEPDSAELVVKRTLANTGRHAIHTFFYTHGFWGQADNGHDAGCWSTVPLQDLAGTAGAVDTTLCRVADLTPTGYWGPLAADEIAEPWYASGYGPSREVFVSTFSERLAWMRIWTHAETYSCEPFLLLDIEPGASKTWTFTRAAVQGLDGASASGPGAVLDLGGPEAEWFQASLATYRPLEDIRVQLRIRPVGADKDLVEQNLVLAKCGPDWPARIRIERNRLPDGPCEVRLTAMHGETVLLDTFRLLEPRTAGLPPAWLGVADGRRAVVFADVTRDNGEIKHSAGSRYWSFALGRAGFQPVVLPVAEGMRDDALVDAGVVVLSGPLRLGSGLIYRLAEYVRQGGGLVVTGPVDFRSFELSDLLPATVALAEITVQAGAPRDGTREFLDAPGQRYQLRAVAEHPALRGIPFHPTTRQGIARLQVIEPRPGAQTLLAYTTPGGLEPQVNSPALVVGNYGQGRVALFASPVYWGSPPSWTIWSRLGEYHQQFLGQLAQWAGGLDGKELGQ